MTANMPAPPSHAIELVLITGMSGSGKSVALTALEDVGFYCVDNLPPELLESFVALEQSHRAEKVAIAMDVRSAASLPGLPERLAHRARALRQAQPGWVVTAAAHSLTAARAGLAGGAHAVVISAVFRSKSPSAGAPLGPLRLAALTRAAGGPVYALGGIHMKNARRLLASGVVGLAAVEGLTPRADP